MDSPVKEDLTPMEEMCLICLTEKYVHLEHCKRTNKCIRHFHVHSSFFNKSFGDANIRPFILFHFLSLLQCSFYIYLTAGFYWTDSASEFFLGKIMLIYTMMSSKVLTTFIIM